MHKNSNAWRMETGQQTREQHIHRSNTRSNGNFHLQLWMKGGKHRTTAKDGCSSQKGSNQKLPCNSCTIDQRCSSWSHQRDQPSLQRHWGPQLGNRVHQHHSHAAAAAMMFWNRNQPCFHGHLTLQCSCRHHHGWWQRWRWRWQWKTHR